MDNPFVTRDEEDLESGEEEEAAPQEQESEADRPFAGARPKQPPRDRLSQRKHPATLGSQLNVAMDTNDEGDEEVALRLRDPEWRKKQAGRLEKEMDIQIQKSRAESAMQQEELYDTLSQSKDRSQTSAVIVIFILEVSVLKDLFLNNSPAGTMFYFVLALIIFAMVLAVTIGFILVYMNNIRSKLRKMDPQHSDSQMAYGTFRMPRTGSLSAPRKGKAGEGKSLMETEDVEPEAGGCLRRLVAAFSSQEETLEERLLRMYKSCYLSELQLTLNFAHTQSHAGSLDRDLMLAAETGAFFEDATFAFPSELLDDNESLTDAKLKEMLDKWHHLKSLRKQGSMLLQRVMQIRRRKLYTGLIRMQNIISHMLFTLIITSILIIGFGFTLSYYPLL